METCHFLSTLHFIYLHIMSPKNYTQHNFLQLFKRRFSHTISELISPQTTLIIDDASKCTDSNAIANKFRNMHEQKWWPGESPFFCFLFTNWGLHRLICKTICTGMITHFMGTVATDTTRSKDSPNILVIVKCLENLKTVNR